MWHLRKYEHDIFNMSKVYEAISNVGIKSGWNRKNLENKYFDFSSLINDENDPRSIETVLKEINLKEQKEKDYDIDFLKKYLKNLEVNSG